jgi:hypothetical protein
VTDKHKASNNDLSQLLLTHLRIKRLYKKACEDLDEHDETTHIEVQLTKPQLSALLHATTKVVER